MAAADEVVIFPTVLYRIDRSTQATAVAEKPEGWGPVALDLEDLANVLEWHGCTHVAMPEEWIGGAGGVDFFEASSFIGMLENSVPA